MRNLSIKGLYLGEYIKDVTKKVLFNKLNLILRENYDFQKEARSSNGHDKTRFKNLVLLMTILREINCKI